jgi:hypothetical protein
MTETTYSAGVYLLPTAPDVVLYEREILDRLILAVRWLLRLR